MVADKTALTRFEGEFQQKSQNSFQKTLLLAKKHHWQTQQRLSDGRILSLQGIDAAENPIYYITHGRYLKEKFYCQTLHGFSKLPHRPK